MASNARMECRNCNEAKGPFFLFRHVGIVEANGDTTEGDLDIPQEDLIVCPSCRICGSIGEFIYGADAGADGVELQLATTEEINAEVKALYEGICQSDGRPFDGRDDAPNVQMALHLKGKTASTTAIIESALRQGFC